MALSPEVSGGQRLAPFRYLTRVLDTAPILGRTMEGWDVPLLPANAPESYAIHKSYDPQR